MPKSNGQLLQSIDKNLAVVMTEQKIMNKDISDIKIDVKEMKKKQAQHDVILTKGSGKISRNWDKALAVEANLNNHLNHHREDTSEKKILGLRIADLIFAAALVAIAIIEILT